MENRKCCCLIASFFSVFILMSNDNIVNSNLSVAIIEKYVRKKNQRYLIVESEHGTSNKKVHGKVWNHDLLEFRIDNFDLIESANRFYFFYAQKPRNFSASDQLSEHHLVLINFKSSKHFFTSKPIKSKIFSSLGYFYLIEAVNQVTN